MVSKFKFVLFILAHIVIDIFVLVFVIYFMYRVLTKK